MQNLFGNVQVNSLDPDRVGVIRVLVVGNTGCGKTSLIRCLTQNTISTKPKTTIGCETYVKLIYYPNSEGKPFFVEFWDVGGQARYKKLRPLFYRDVNGVILVYDVANSWSYSSLHKWAEEIALKGTFVAPLPVEIAQQNFGGLRVPILTVANKSDLLTTAKNTKLSIWQQFLGLIVKKQTEQIKKSDSSSIVTCCALNGNVDMEPFDSFLLKLVERKFYSGDVV
eukprot:TRINITY_DN40376_c0_g1_i2.p1 TRINITY_DN40376_c0_g1~~TRINITY_DN40376_c0_g1_i2.p1  ORF type:complete len:225 (-),score=18.57 TRINITY_DN40376_c0_g1_i2:67-741(-)